MPDLEPNAINGCVCVRLLMWAVEILNKSNANKCADVLDGSTNVFKAKKDQSWHKDA